MWIERLELIGFGSLIGKKIEFAKDKLNLVVEGNEYGKSTIAEAIWSVLYDFPARQKTTDDKLKERDARRPSSGEPFKACLDIICKGRSLRLVRDFSERTLKVFDRDHADVEVTKEFLSGSTQDEAGSKLVGLGRDLFKATCFVGQRDLDENALSGDRKLSSLLQSIADSSGSSATSASAIEVLEDSLSNFPANDKKMRLERVIRDLEDRHQLFQQEVGRLESERQSVSQELLKLSNLENTIKDKEDELKATEYFKLCIDLADVDQRLASSQERLLKTGDLKRQLLEVNKFQNFPIARTKELDELWTRRKSRFEDHEKLSKEINEHDQQIKAKDLKLRERYPGLTKFTVDDAGMLSSLARTFQTALTELSDSKQKHEVEHKRVEESGVELDSLSDVRKSLLNLDAKEVDDAYAYNANLKSSREQITQIEPATWRARMLMQEVQEQQKQQAAKWLKLRNTAAILSGVLAAVEVAVTISKLGFAPVAIGLLLFIALTTTVVALVLMSKAKSYRQDDYHRAKEEQENQATLGQELHSKVMGLEVRLDNLARKAGLNSGVELVKELQSYAISAPQLKDLDLLEHIIDSRESQITRLRTDIEPYFTKAKRPVDSISPESATALAEQMSQCLEEARALKSSTDFVENKGAQLKFLSDELLDLDTQIRDVFTHAKLEQSQNIERGYQEFCEAADAYRRFESVKAELSHHDETTASDIVPGNLVASVEKLTNQRNDLWSRLEDLIARHPEITELPPPSDTASSHTDIAASRNVLEELRKEREQLAIHVKSATREYDEEYLEALQELEAIEHELNHLIQTKAALQLALETFKRLSKETHAQWANRLNEISKEMLGSLGTDYESLHFDEDLDLTARRKGQSEPLQPAQINSQLSTGTREQIHWLARMCVAKFLSQDDPLPIILDEPFSEADDQRFLNMMRFLIDTVLPHHQTILFSCHQKRHQALVDELNADQQKNVGFCELQSLN